MVMITLFGLTCGLHMGNPPRIAPLSSHAASAASLLSLPRATPSAAAVAAAHVRRPRSSAKIALNAGIEFDFDEDEDEDDEDGFFRETDNAMEQMDAMLTDKPAANLTVAELQAQLKQLGQRATGTRKELIERVQLMQRKRAFGLPIHEMQVKRVSNMEWYMLQTANGFERAVERTLNQAIRAQRLEGQIERVWVPILEGETSVRESSVMPSYIFVKMKMSAALHFLISEMQYVINFVGADRGGRSMSGQMVGNRGFVRPVPITDEAYWKVVALTKAKLTTPVEEEAQAQPAFVIDDLVEVSEGPFKGMNGPVLEVSEGAGELTLALTVMGRNTPVTLPLEHCVRLEAAV